MKLASPQTETSAVFVPRHEEELTSPTLLRALKVWKGQCQADGSPPGARDFDVLDYRQVISNINLIEVCEPPLDFVFRVHSVTGSDYVGLDLTGRSIWDYPDPLYGSFVRDICRRAKEEKKVQIAIEDVLVQRRQTSYDCLYRWEAVVMPLVGDSGKVARLVFAFDLDRIP